MNRMGSNHQQLSGIVDYAYIPLQKFSICLVKGYIALSGTVQTGITELMKKIMKFKTGVWFIHTFFFQPCKIKFTCFLGYLLYSQESSPTPMFQTIDLLL